ncbi:hypothetical protein [uncultured Treponema sp.]|uniref:hypothetical protein n=1 Tax=uncultured Treponema sp. TaxID=162155 RepID=UPI0025F738B2|nr:hypothetical protein [uncultured Treponema sp.]
MSDYAVSDIMAHINDFSYDERKSLFQTLKASLKRKPKRIRLARGNGKEAVITKSLTGIFKDTSVTLEDAKDKRLARQ